MRWWPLSRRQPRPERPGETWLYLPPGVPGGREEIRVNDTDGHDFARFSWQTCKACRTGLVIAIRIDPKYQHRGYGARLLRHALRDHEDYAWTTSAQKTAGKPFFRRMSQNTGVPFGDGHKPVLCPHMRAAPSNPQPGPAQAMRAVD